MTHFFVVAMVPMSTPEDEIEQRVITMMTPYDHDLDMPRQKYYLTEKDIKSISRYEDAKEPEEVAKLLYGWYGTGKGGVDEQGIYHLSTRNHRAKWDWWRIGGRWNGEICAALRDDGAGGFNFGERFERLSENIIPAHRVDHKIEACAVLTPDGAWHEPEDEDEENPAWQEKVTSLIQQHQDCYLIGLDVHH